MFGVGPIITIIVIVFLLFLLFGGLRTSMFFQVHTQENVIVERFSKFLRVAGPGLNFKAPLIDSLTRPISLRVQQLEVNIETKTKDNVFVTIPVAVQYVVDQHAVVDAYYKLSDPEDQIRSYVFDTVRSALSGLTLDTAFESKDDIANTVEQRLSQSMAEYGFRIVNTLVTDISPDQRVRDSMNSINAAQRERDAAQSLAAGIEDTAEQLLLMTQYFDTLQDVARNGRSNVLLLPSNPGALGDLANEIRTTLLTGYESERAREAGDTRIAQETTQQRATQERTAADQARLEAAYQAQARAQQSPAQLPATHSARPQYELPESAQQLAGRLPQRLQDQVNQFLQQRPTQQ